ncbi:Chaperone protein ClpD chloroplastic, partial [Zea mays]
MVAHSASAAAAMAGHSQSPPARPKLNPVWPQPSIRGSKKEDAVKILLGLREKYETYHKCKYTLEGINAALYLSARYIPDRHLPDKAIDLIDEAGSIARMESFKRKKEEQCSILSKSPNEYWQEIRAVQSTHEVALANRLKYSLDENDKEDGVNIEVIGDNKIASPSMPPTSINIWWSQ